MTKYDYELLKRVLTRDKCTVTTPIQKLNRDTKIQGTCSCGTRFCKSFRQMDEKGGGFCKNCERIKRRQKMANTNMKRYGVAHAS